MMRRMNMMMYKNSIINYCINNNNNNNNSRTLLQNHTTGSTGGSCSMKIKILLRKLWVRRRQLIIIPIEACYKLTPPSQQAPTTKLPTTTTNNNKSISSWMSYHESTLLYNSTGTQQQQQQQQQQQNWFYHHTNYYINPNQQQQQQYQQRRTMVTVHVPDSYNRNRIIDYRSDTITKPSPDMLQTILTSQLGDDVYGEDPTVQELQYRVASMFHKEAALLVPSGTMSNLCAILGHCTKRGSEEIIIGSKSHINLWHSGNIATLGSIPSKQIVENDLTAELDLTTLYDTIIPDDSDDHMARTAVICIETTHNEIGGIPLRPQYLDDIGRIAHDTNNNNNTSIAVHVDGARIWNAITSLQIPVDNYCQSVDSISVAFSKGLGVPLGSMIIGSTDFIRRAKRARKQCGGGMRQSGIIAGMCLYALDTNLPKLHHDHDKAQRLAKQLYDAGFIFPRNPNGFVPTNIFYITLPPSTTTSITPQEFQQRLEQDYGIRIAGGYGSRNKQDTFRIVTHLDIYDEDINYTANAMIQLCK